MQTSHLQSTLRLQLIDPVIESQPLNRFRYKPGAQRPYLLHPGGDEEQITGNHQY